MVLNAQLTIREARMIFVQTNLDDERKCPSTQLQPRELLPEDYAYLGLGVSARWISVTTAMCRGRQRFIAYRL